MFKSFETLSNLKLDPVPNFIYNSFRSKHAQIADARHLQNSDNSICTNPSNLDIISLKNMILESPKVTEIIDLQWEDGSWGRFHSMDTSSKSNMTTEKALRKLLNIGFNSDDEAIKKAVRYMEDHLDRLIEFRDYKEKKHDWDLLTQLFAATWLLRIDRSNKKANYIADKWAMVITNGFSNGNFCEDAYRSAYDEILKPEKGKEYWKIDNFHIVSILKDRLDIHTEELYLKHIMNNHRGIYYIYDKKLSEFPSVNQGKSFVRYLNAIGMVLDYGSGFSHLGEIIENLNSLKDNDGLWDFGKTAKDDVTLPLSENWRTDEKRKADCTILALGLIGRYNTSLKETSCEKVNNI